MNFNSIEFLQNVRGSFSRATRPRALPSFEFLNPPRFSAIVFEQSDSPASLWEPPPNTVLTISSFRNARRRGYKVRTMRRVSRELHISPFPYNVVPPSLFPSLFFFFFFFIFVVVVVVVTWSFAKLRFPFRDYRRLRYGLFYGRVRNRLRIGASYPARVNGT